MATFSVSLKEAVRKLPICLLLCNLASGWLYPFRNESLSWDERVDDLVHRLTLYEIVNQSSVAVAHPPPAIARLGIQPYLWATECLRGYVRRNATAFPDSLGLAASFRYDWHLLISIRLYSGTCTHGLWEFSLADEIALFSIRDRYVSQICFTDMFLNPDLPYTTYSLSLSVS